MTSSALFRPVLLCIALLLAQVVSVSVAYATSVSVDFTRKTGLMPFDANDNPGNDSGPDNTIIRTNDVIAYRFEVAVQDGDATNIVLNVSVSPGLRLNLPAFCRTSGVTPVSSITGDPASGYSLVCNVGAIGEGAQVLYSIPATVTPDRPQGSTVSLLGASIRSDQTPAETFPGGTDTVSATPKLDLAKNTQVRLIKRAEGPSGEPGIVYAFPIVVTAKNEAKGNELVTSDISFTDDLATGVSPNARLFQGWSGALSSACMHNMEIREYNLWNLPYGSTRIADGGPGGPGGGAGVAERSVWNSGSILCTEDLATSTATVTISGADLSARHAPTQNRLGNALQADLAYLVSGVMVVWIPTQDVTDAGNELAVNNVYSALSATSISSQPNVEPDSANNTVSFIARDGPGTRSFYNHIDYNRFGLLPGQTSRRSGNGYVLADGIFATRHYQYNRAWVSKTRYDDYVFCTSFDNSRQVVHPITPGVAAVIHLAGTFDGGQPPFIIEYGTGTFGTSSTCDDPDSPTGWQDTIDAVPGGPSAITKVRAKTAYIAPPGGDSTSVIASLVVRYKALPGPAGSIVAEWGSYKTSSLNSGNWFLSQYDAQTGLGRYGDRLTLTSILARINKETVPSGRTEVLAGDPVTFVLQPSATAPGSVSGSTTTVTVTDTLPSEYSYTLGSASPAPTTETSNPDGSTTLVWEFPNTEVNQPMASITYGVVVKSTTTDQAQPQNVAVVSSPADGSVEPARTDSYTLLVVNPAGFSVFKSPVPVLVAPNAEFGYDLTYANTGTSDFDSVVMIDILPNENVVLTPPTNFSGSAVFKSVSGTSGEVFEYTKRDPTQIEWDPLHASNQPGGATTWCAAYSGGACPASAAEVTGFRATSPSFPQNQPPRVISALFEAQGNGVENVYSNRFTARAEGLSFPVTSPVASVRVRTADISLSKQVVGPDPVTPEIVTFVLTLANAGPHASDVVSVRDRLPAGYAYVSHEGGIYDPASGIWSVPNVAVDGTQTLTIRARVLAGGDYVNTAEVSAQGYADPDSQPDNGVPSEDDIDSASILARLAGKLFEDNGSGSGTAHDGILNGGETQRNLGTAEVRRASDNTLLASAVIAGDGSWSAILPSGTPEDLIVSVSPNAGYRPISENTGTLPGLTNPVPTDGIFEFQPLQATEYAALDFGLIARPLLSQDQTVSVAPGQIVQLPHRYIATTAGSVAFSLADQASNPQGAFSPTLFEDVSCDGSADYPLTGMRSVIAGETVCLIVRTQAGSGIGSGATFSYALVATTNYANTAVTETLRNQDSMASSGQGGGDLLLRKLVQNLTQNTPEAASNAGRVGDVLRYRIILSNPGTTPATNVEVFDATPAYTALSGTLPPSVTVLAGVTCTLTDPGTKVADYRGPLAWVCPGSFPPGAEGSLTFDVTIAP